MSLNQHLIRLIAQQGPISIAQFMHEALLNPEFGYYTTGKPFGREGDFITAPEISQVFGELIGAWCAHTWQDMGKPSNIALVELGPGKGTLMLDMLRATRQVKGFLDSVNIYMVEASPKLAAVQRHTLAAYGNIHWVDTLESVPKQPILLVANEFFDALPIHQYVKTPKGWAEQMIGAKDNRLVFNLAPVSPLSDALNEHHAEAPLGAIVELCPQATSTVHYIAARIRNEGGAALCIDYGYDHYGYKDTLQAVKNHHYHPVLDDIGQADITAHVDFTALAKAATMPGIQVAGPVTQGHFLRGLGIELRTQALVAKATAQQQKNLISGTERLISDAKMGSLFKVLVLMDARLPAPAGF